MRERVKKILLAPEAKIREAMLAIEEAPHHKPEPAPSGIALVVAKDNTLLGVITDGDIRRAILDKADLEENVTSIMKKNPITVPHGKTPEEMMHAIVREIESRNIADHRIDKVVVVDGNNKVLDVISFFEIWKNSEVKTKNVSIIGLGYVGLTLALTLTDVGFKVFGIDTDKRIIASLKRGKSHVHELGLTSLLRHHIGQNFIVDTDLLPNRSDIYIVAVNTPVERGKVVTRYLEDALRSVGRVLKLHDTVILRSTVPVGTSRQMAVSILERASGFSVGEEIYLAFAPERTVEGKALEELRTLPQVVGGINKASVEIASRLFKSITNVIVPVESLEAAEMIKLINNSFRDLSFAYSNEVAQLADKFNLNAFELILAANNGYPRDKIPLPSPGVGGACLTKDPLIFSYSAKKVGFDIKLPLLGREINLNMIDYVAERLDKFFKQNKTKGPKKVFVMGVAFKGEPETSDIRFSTAVSIVKAIEKKYQVFVYDPVVKRSEIKKAAMNYASVEDGFKGASAVLILNNHHFWREIDVYRLLSRMKKPAFFFDGWNMFSGDTIENVPKVTYGTFGK